MTPCGMTTTIHRLTTGKVSDPIAEALESFEKEFHYPLGKGRSFSISHSPDYPLFYASMSENSFVLAAERKGVILGTLGAAIKPVRCPDGVARTAAYLGDLKLAPSVRTGRVFWRLTNAAREALAARCENRAYGVVMDGTSRIPSSYTGRWGVDPFHPLGRVIVFRIPVINLMQARTAPGPSRVARVTGTRLENAFYSGAPEAFIPTGGSSSLRSRMDPIGLSLTDGSAGGIVEDTRRGKRLFDDGSSEMLSAHLSAFHWRDAESGVRLIREALTDCGRLGFSHLFTAVPASSLPAFQHAMAKAGWREVIEAPASIFGCGFDASDTSDWRVNTAEI
ncbi:MAG: hypothetical protein ACI9NQ_001694 [Paracoccaceae bacterium]|jgi:hypothetical protein